MNYKIVGAKLVVADGDNLCIKQENLYIKGDEIVSVGKECQGDFETVNADGKLVMPGLINMHSHVYMSLFRNYADDVNFDEWLFKRIMPVEDRLNCEAAYWSCLFNCMEMILTGTTCFMDMHLFEGASAKAARDIGMRGYISRCVVGEDLYTDGLSRFNQMLSEQQHYQSDTIKFLFAPHAIYTVSPKMYEQITKESQKRGLLRMTHLSESDNEVQNCLKTYNKTPVELLYSTGFLGEQAILAHCVKLNDNDIKILSDTRSNVVTNPASNCKLGNGFAPVNAMRKAGINICLGTDSNASNNTQNMFREMGIFTLIHKGLACDSVEADAQFVLDTATRNAAKALGMDGKLGVIAPGAKADIIFLDLKSPSLFPANNIISSLCYSANGSEVESVMIGGKFVMKNREFVNIDSERVYFELQKVVDTYL